MSIKLSKDKIFHSFEELDTFIHDYGKSVFEKFILKSSTILNIDNKERVSRLKYQYIYYSCKFGGVKYRPESSGIRENTSTYKVNCPAKINVKYHEKKNGLVITYVQLSHENHDDSKDYYELLPEVRRLTPTEQEDVRSRLDLRCNKKLLQQDIIKKFNKHVLIKDLHNIKYNKYDNDDLEKSLRILLEKDATPQLLIEDNVFKALYFSTSRMRQCMTAWPEIVFIDGTYKLLKMGLTVMILMIEDANTLSEIVAVCLIQQEDYSTFKWFLETFKKENASACKHINGIMADKDLLERDCLKEVFGEQIPIFVCLWHALKTFQRRITKSEMGITEDERIYALQLIEKMAYSKGEKNYDESYDIFKETVPKKVLDYYNKNWHNIRHEWALSVMAFGNLGNRTNNRLESLNGKIKQVVQKNSTLVTFCKSFFDFLESHRLRNFEKTSKAFTKTSTKNYDQDSDHNKYMNILTYEAFQYILPELKRFNKVDVKSQNAKYFTESSDTQYYITTKSCECSTWRSLMLPCRHIFALRKLKEKPLFSKKLCNNRWRKEYYQSIQKLLQQTQKKLAANKKLKEDVLVHEIITNDPFDNPVDKNKFVTSLMMTLTNSCCNASGSYFENRLNILEKLLSFWSNNVKVILKDESNLDSSIQELRSLSIKSTPVQKKPLQPSQKRNRSKKKIDDIKKAILDSTIKLNFDEKIVLIKQLIHYWTVSNEVDIVSLEDDLNALQASTSMAGDIGLDLSEDQWEVVPLYANEETFENQEEYTHKKSTENEWEAIPLAFNQETLESQEAHIEELNTDNIWEAIPLPFNQETLESQAVLLSDNKKNKTNDKEKYSSQKTLNVHELMKSLNDLDTIKMPVSEITRGRPAKHLETWVRIKKKRLVSASFPGREKNLKTINIKNIKMLTSHISKGRPRGTEKTAIGLKRKKGKK